MEHKDKLEEFKKRRAQLLEIVEAGVTQRTIAKELGISEPRVSQLIKQAKRERENDTSSGV